MNTEDYEGLKLSFVDFCNKYSSRQLVEVSHTANKSQITDEICQKIIELYKISIILSTTYSLEKEKEYTNLFFIKYLELQKLWEDQMQKVADFDGEILSKYKKKNIDNIEFINSKYPNINNSSEEIAKLSNEDIRIIIFNSVLLRFYDQIKYIKDYITSYYVASDGVDSSLDVDGDLKRMIHQKYFSEASNQALYLEVQGMEARIIDINRLGFNSNYICEIIYSIVNRAKYYIDTKYKNFYIQDELYINY